MHSDLENGYEFKKSRSLSDIAQQPFGLNTCIFKSYLSETNRILEITYSDLLITRTGINFLTVVYLKLRTPEIFEHQKLLPNIISKCSLKSRTAANFQKLNF